MSASKSKIKKERTPLQKTVNTFLFFFIGVGVLLIIFFGFSQTATFRNYLREKVVELADSTLNGKIFIEKIDGTIFTSLILRNSAVTMDEDTLLKAEKIELKISPLQIFLKRIHFRKFELANAYISLIKDSSGILNIERLLPAAEEDTSKSEFPFKIRIADLSLNQVDFKLQNYDRKGSNAVYSSINFDDLRIKNINLSLSVFADIKNDEYSLQLNHLSFTPNLTFFNLENLSGAFGVSRDEININNLKLETVLSQLNVNLSLTGFNIFEEFNSTDLGDSDLRLRLAAAKFNFADLTSFIEDTDLLKGELAVDAEFDGKFRDFRVNGIELQYNNTHLKCTGRIKNLEQPEKLFISAGFKDTYIYQPDVNKLLPSLEIPIYPEYGLLRSDSLSYEGSPLKFTSKINLNTNRGNIRANLFMDISKDIIDYDLSFETENLNLESFAGLKTKLNSQGSVKGKGFVPEELQTALKIDASNSILGSQKFDSFRINADAQNKIINFDLNVLNDSTHGNFYGMIDFAVKDDPYYNLNGKVSNLNLSPLVGDSTLITNLNFSMLAEGKNFDPDKMNSSLHFLIFNSTLDGYRIDSANFDLDIRCYSEGRRSIVLNSDLADAALKGNFIIQNSLDLIAFEAEFLRYVIKTKATQYQNQAEDVSSGTRINSNSMTELLAAYPGVDSAAKIDFSLRLKHFELLSLISKGNQIEVDGILTGTLTNTEDSIFINLNANLEYLKFWGAEDVFFFSNFEFALDFRNAFGSYSLNQLAARTVISAKRIFTGNDFKDFRAEVKLNRNKIDYSLAVNIEDYFKADLGGTCDLSGDSIKINFNKFGLRYNRYDLLNKGNIYVIYYDNNFFIRNLLLNHNKTEINIHGLFALAGEHNLSAIVNNLSGSELALNLLNIDPESFVDGRINLSSSIKGTFLEPIISVDLNVDNLIYKRRNFGFFKAGLNYFKKELQSDFMWLDSTQNYTAPRLWVKGNIPIDLSFSNVRKRILDDEPVNLSILSKNFNLAAFGNTLPLFDKLQGIVDVNVSVSGTFKHLRQRGYLSLSSASFVFEGNSLEYGAGLKLSIEDEKIFLDSMVIENLAGTSQKGRLIGSGSATLDGFDVKSAAVKINGDLFVLTNNSKSVSPAVYGDLFVGTDGNITFTVDRNKYYLKAPIIVKESKLVFPPTQTAYQSSVENFIYRYHEDTSKVSDLEKEFQKLINLSYERQAQRKREKSITSSLDYDIGVKIKDEATLVFIISREYNLKLTAALKGELNYERINGINSAQGELKLLQESNLEFFKTLEASGSIRFESDVSNPYLNIIATYKNYYSETPNSTKEVAVKIKLEGSLKELDKNLTQREDNVLVYEGAANIENEVPSENRDKTNALFFILTGDFNPPTSSIDNAAGQTQDKLKGTGISLAGSLLGGFLSTYLGDFVRSVELQSTAVDTRFNVSGRYKDFRYTIGGSTDTFQDFSTANVKIEYPVFENFLLRLERRQALSETNISPEMVNELGLKYRIEF